MKSQESEILYLAHEDFCKLSQWELIEALDGSFIDQLRAYEETLDAHGYLPTKVYREREKFVRDWKAPARFSHRVCVDVETGEVHIPLEYALLNDANGMAPPFT